MILPRWRWWFLAALFLAVVIAAIYLPILRRNIKQAARTARRKRTVAHLRKKTRSALGKEGAKAARRKRGSSK